MGIMGRLILNDTRLQGFGAPQEARVVVAARARAVVQIVAPVLLGLQCLHVCVVQNRVRPDVRSPRDIPLSGSLYM